jgi:hypothetical protein
MPHNYLCERKTARHIARRGATPLGRMAHSYVESSVSISLKASSASSGSIFPLSAAVLPASIATENRSLADCASGLSLAVVKMSGRNLVITASSRSSVTCSQQEARRNRRPLLRSRARDWAGTPAAPLRDRVCTSPHPEVFSGPISREIDRAAWAGLTGHRCSRFAPLRQPPAKVRSPPARGTGRGTFELLGRPEC